MTLANNLLTPSISDGKNECVFCGEKFAWKDSVFPHYLKHTQVMALILGLHQRVFSYKEFEAWHLDNIQKRLRS